MQFAYCNLQRGIIPSQKVIIGGVKVLVLCTSYDNALYLYQILSTSISKGFRVSDLKRMVDASVVANAYRRMYEGINRKKTGSLYSAMPEADAKKPLINNIKVNRYTCKGRNSTIFSSRISRG